MKFGKFLKVTEGQILHGPDDWSGTEWRAEITLQAPDLPLGQDTFTGTGTGKSAHVALKRAVDDALT